MTNSKKIYTLSIGFSLVILFSLLPQTSLAAPSAECKKEVDSFFQFVKNAAKIQPTTSYSKNRSEYHEEIYILARKKIIENKGLLGAIFNFSNVPFLADETAKDDLKRAKNFAEDPIHALYVALHASNDSEKNPFFCTLIKEKLVKHYEKGTYEIRVALQGKNSASKKSAVEREIDGRQFTASLEKRIDSQGEILNPNSLDRAPGFSQASKSSSLSD
jgi:hypothetical protein